MNKYVAPLPQVFYLALCSPPQSDKGGPALLRKAGGEEASMDSGEGGYICPLCL
jgi:hypothetical protein